MIEEHETRVPQGDPQFRSCRQPGGETPLVLPARLDTQAAGQLYETLCSRRGKPLVIDAGAVSFLGALAAQVLVSAKRQWDIDGHPLTFAPSPERLARQAAALGIQADRLHSDSSCQETT